MIFLLLLLIFLNVNDDTSLWELKALRENLVYKNPTTNHPAIQNCRIISIYY